MVNKHMKVKTTMSYHFTSTKMATIKKLKKLKKLKKSIGKDMKKLEPSGTAGGDAKWYSHYRKQLDTFSES